MELTTSCSAEMKLANLLLERGKPVDALAVIEGYLQQRSLCSSGGSSGGERFGASCSGSGTGSSADLLVVKARCLFALGKLEEVREAAGLPCDA